MDGFSTTQGVVVLAGTNRPDILDKVFRVAVLQLLCRAWTLMWLTVFCMCSSTADSGMLSAGMLLHCRRCCGLAGLIGRSASTGPT